MEKICRDRDTTVKPCKYYIKPGLCSLSNHFRCIEYMVRIEFELDYTHYSMYCNCPYSYYLAYVLGIERIEKPLIIRRGSYIHDCLAYVQKGELNEINPNDYFKNDEEREKTKAKSIIESMIKLELIPVDKAIPEFKWYIKEYDMPKLYGTIDLIEDSPEPTWFVEYKYTESPDFYLNSILATTQLHTYMLAKPSLKYCWIRPIRVPQLKSTGQYMDESEESYQDRLIKDILKRPGYYFPNYDKEKKTWGVKYYRENFDIEELKLKYRMVSLDIIRDIKRNYFRQNERACLSPSQCQFYEACATGGFSELLYKIPKEVTNEDLETN